MVDEYASEYTVSGIVIDKVDKIKDLEIVFDYRLKFEEHIDEKINRPKSENWATLTPRSSATIRRREKLTYLRNFLALGLQIGVNNISLQCIP